MLQHLRSNSSASTGRNRSTSVAHAMSMRTTYISHQLTSHKRLTAVMVNDLPLDSQDMKEIAILRSKANGM